MRKSCSIVVLALACLASGTGAVQAANNSTNPAASAASVKFGARAAVLTKTSSATWTGKALSDQFGTGKLTLTGKVTFRTDGEPTHSLLRFRAAFKRGFVSGCLYNATALRPGNRQVWDGPGQITSTSSSLRRYRGLLVRGGGVSQANDLTHAKPFGVASGPGPGKKCQ